jgi:hypothetical protein
MMGQVAKHIIRRLITTLNLVKPITSVLVDGKVEQALGRLQLSNSQYYMEP